MSAWLCVCVYLLSLAACLGVQRINPSRIEEAVCDSESGPVTIPLTSDSTTAGGHSVEGAGDGGWTRERLGKCRGIAPLVAVLVSPSAIRRYPRGVHRVTIVLAPLAPLALFVLLCRLRSRRQLEITEPDLGWLVAIFAVGSTYLPTVSLGGLQGLSQALGAIAVLGLLLCTVAWYVPVAAGLAYGLAILARPELLPAVILFACAALQRMNLPAAADGRIGSARPGHREALRDAALFLLPIVLLSVLVTPARLLATAGPPGPIPSLGRLTSGEMRFAYLSENLTQALALVPSALAASPWLCLSSRGLAIWVTTPAILWLLGARLTTGLQRALALSILMIAAMGLVERPRLTPAFGYSNGLDVIALVLVLLALVTPKISRWFKAFALAGMAMNLLGALSQGSSRIFHPSTFPPGIN